MKLMFLIPHVANGGAEKILSELVMGVKADEIVVVVFEKRIDYPIRGKLISLDLPIRPGVLHRLAGLVRRMYRFRKVLGAERPDVVVSFMGEANILNVLLSARPIVTVHNHLSSLGKFARGPIETFFSEFLVGVLYRRATVVAVSNVVKREMVERFQVPARQVVVIPNAIDSHNVQAKAAEPLDCPWNSNLPVIATAGRLTRQKGQWRLIHAFAEVRKQIPCQLAILGVGELEGELKRLTREAGVEKDVFFLGWQANPWKFMARSQIFVLPSLTEGFGLVLLEAMACGLPVISTDCPGAARDILALALAEDAVVNGPEYGEYGVLVPVESAPVLAEAILHLLRDKDAAQRYTKAGLKRIEDFDYPLFLSRYQQVIESTFRDVGQVERR